MIWYLHIWGIDSIGCVFLLYQNAYNIHSWHINSSVLFFLNTSSICCMLRKFFSYSFFDVNIGYFPFNLLPLFSKILWHSWNLSMHFTHFVIFGLLVIFPDVYLLVIHPWSILRPFNIIPHWMLLGMTMSTKVSTSGRKVDTIILQHDM